MSDYLKGNYRMKREGPKVEAPKPKNEFEAKALKKLGGSVSFVRKSAFTWKGDRKDDAAGTAGK